MLIVKGAHDAEIATWFVISENTVETHLYQVYEKLRVKNWSNQAAWVKRIAESINRIVPEKSP